MNTKKETNIHIFLWIKKCLGLTVLFSALIPGFAFAQAPNTFQDVIQLFIDFNLKLLLPMAFSAGLLFFMWRGAMYILNSKSEEGKTEGRRILTWGVVALFLMVSFFGIIKFFQDDTVGVAVPTEIKPLQRTSK